MAQVSAMDLPGNGLHVIQGELSILLSSIRRPFKLSSQTYREEEQDNLMKNLNQLKEELSQVSSLSELELLSVLGPFLEVIRSEDTSGPVTELALSSVFKFLSYGLIDPNHESAAVAVEILADAVTHARFVGTGSEEIVLMKILHVLKILVLHPAGILLSNESICEIMQSCFRICFETRLSELLRKSAEHSLSEMVRLLYARLPQFPLQEAKGSVNYKKLKMRTAAYDPSRNKKKSRSPKPNRPKSLSVHQSSSKSNLAAEVSPGTETPEAVIESPTTDEPVENHPDPESAENGASTVTSVDGNCLPTQTEDESYINTQGVRFITNEPSSNIELPIGKNHVPYGLPCVRELLRFLISLINPMEGQNSEAMIHVGLKLLTVAVETAADIIVSVPTLLILIQDETCRYLFALLNSERITVIAATCRLCFLLMESARTRLKFQLETYVIKLMEIVAQESPKMSYERRLVALEALGQLCRIPGLLAELYLNYDCDCHTSDLFEDLVKHLSKNVAPVAAGGIYSIHLVSLETLLILVEAVEAHCLNDSGSEGVKTLIKDPPAARKCRLEVTSDGPSRDHLSAVRHKKKLLIAGVEHFNSKPAKGIQFLQENGLLSDPLDPNQVAVLLRECSRLDKKMIGEYVSNRKNLIVLEAFVRSFDFRSIRIDEAVRLYLEAFRLPGEAPLIFPLVEQFADHWFKCNDAPFCNAGAACTLAYAVIMLNVDQHNNNVKRQNIPMTVDEFKRNLSKVNGGQDFDPSMLEDIYQAIRSEEIVMPAEQTGIVKDNYLWKMLLRRGSTKDGHYLHPPNGQFDTDVFDLSWMPIVTALGSLMDKTSSQEGLMEWLSASLAKVSTNAAHFRRSDVFDYVIQLLVKWTTLLPGNDHPPIQAVTFGQNRKAQLTTATMFQLVHRYGDMLNESWKPVVDCIMQFYRMRILPDNLVEAEDLFDPNVKVKLISEDAPSSRSETSGLFSSIYSYIALSEGSAGVRAGSAKEQEAVHKAKTCVLECCIEQLINDSKFLQTKALQDFIKVLIGLNGAATSSAEEYGVIFVLELITRITVQNRDRVTCIWNSVRDHIYSLLMGAAAAERQFVLERSIVGLLLLTGRLMRREDVAPIVLQSLRMLLLLKPTVLSKVSRQVSYGLHELLKTGAANVHTTGDWRVLFTLLECVGAGAQPPSFRGGDSLAPSTSMDAISDTDHIDRTEVDASSDRGYTSDSELYDSCCHTAALITSATAAARGSSLELNVPAAGGGGWIFVGRQGELEHLKGKQLPGREYNIVHDRTLLAHDPLAFVKSCESLAFLVRDVAHITPENFECAVQCIRTFVEASLNSFHFDRNNKSKHQTRPDNFRRSKSVSLHTTNNDPCSIDDLEGHELPSNYHQVPIQLLDLIHTLHTRAAQIYQASEGGEQVPDQDQHSPSLWVRGWCPLLQGIARLCCDSRKQVRTTAITYLQRSLFVHDLQSLTAAEWESCFNTVLFPLLGKLLEPVRHHHQRAGDALTRAQVAADNAHWEETRIRAATLLSKVFLEHLGPLLQLPTFTALWLTLLDFMDKYMHVEHNDMLAEAIPEMMKNLLLVMETVGAFDDSPPPAGDQTIQMKAQLWNLTCDRIDVFLPGLRQEVTRSRTPMARVPSLPAVVPEASEDEVVVTLPKEESDVKAPPEEVAVPAPALGFVPAAVFSLFNVPDPSDAASFFFYNVDPSPSVEEGSSEEYRPVSIVPVFLIPEEDNPAGVPLPIFTPVDDPQDEILPVAVLVKPTACPSEVFHQE